MAGVNLEPSSVERESGQVGKTTAINYTILPVYTSRALFWFPRKAYLTCFIEKKRAVGGERECEGRNKRKKTNKGGVGKVRERERAEVEEKIGWERAKGDMKSPEMGRWIDGEQGIAGWG